MTSYVAAANGITLLSIRYVRDMLGRIAEKTETIEGVTDTYGYAHDQTGQLTNVMKNGVTTASYSYDSNGNRLSGPGFTVPSIRGAQDRLLEYSDADYTYTADGELKTKTVGGQTTTYNYDLLGNLVGVALPGGTRIDYLIDASNRQMGKRTDGVLAHVLLYQDWLKPSAELDRAGNVVGRFVYAGRVNVPSFVVKGGSTYRVITDHLGSSRLMVDTVTGAVVQRVDYDEFGRVERDTRPGFVPFGFAGGIRDVHTDFVRFGRRDYFPAVGRWTKKDTILFSGGRPQSFSVRPE